MIPVQPQNTGPSEPIGYTEAGRVLIIAIGVVLVAFHVWRPSPDQMGAVLGLYAAISGLLSMYARTKSVPLSHVATTKAQEHALNLFKNDLNSLATGTISSENSAPMTVDIQQGAPVVLTQVPPSPPIQVAPPIAGV